MAITNFTGAALDQQAAILDARAAKSASLNLDVMGKRLPESAKPAGDGASLSSEALAPAAPQNVPGLGALQQNFLT